MIGVKVALVGLSLPDRGRPPAEVGRGGLLADTGRDGPGLHANMTHLHSCGCRKHEKGWLHAVGPRRHAQHTAGVDSGPAVLLVCCDAPGGHCKELGYGDWTLVS